MEDVKPPLCCHCQKPARLTDGREVYPRHPDLYEKPIWRCECGAYVGCHPGTRVPLGTPADQPLRRARQALHNRRVDPIWMTADGLPFYKPESDQARWQIRRTARSRLYAFLATKLGISEDECHIGMFDMERCRAAWHALYKVEYPQIREWAKSRREAA